MKRLQFHCPDALKNSLWGDFTTPYLWPEYLKRYFSFKTCVVWILAQDRVFSNDVMTNLVFLLRTFWEEQCLNTFRFLLQYCSLLLPSFDCTAFPKANINNRINFLAKWKGYFPVILKGAQLFWSITLPWLTDIRRSVKYTTWFFFKYIRSHLFSNHIKSV